MADNHIKTNSSGLQGCKVRSCPPVGTGFLGVSTHSHTWGRCSWGAAWTRCVPHSWDAPGWGTRIRSVLHALVEPLAQDAGLSGTVSPW